MVRFGITERGDVAFSDDWIPAVRGGAVAAAVVISKGLPTADGRRFLVFNSEQIIFHATTTGFGGTELEPNVKPAMERLDELDSFCNGDFAGLERGFPKDHVVIRIDPMIPTTRGLARAMGVAHRAGELGFKRIRWSWIDLYPHVLKRFAALGLNLAGAIDEAKKTCDISQEWRNARVRLTEDFGITFESCAEQEECVGCISPKDFELCGLDPNEAQGKSGQRQMCMCCANKTELLNERHRCPFQCLYCYWHD